MASTLENESTLEEGPHVLSSKLGGGPLGLGDPDDRTLRRAEKEILIPQKMKSKAKTTICADQVRGFGECAKEKGLMMPFRCRPQAKELEKCLSAAYTDQAFIDLCTEEYLRERSIFRRTGVKAKSQKKDIAL